MIRWRMSFELKKVDEEDRTAQAHQTQRKPRVENQRIQDDKVERLLYTQPPRTGKRIRHYTKLTLT